MTSADSSKSLDLIKCRLMCAECRLMRVLIVTLVMLCPSTGSPEATYNGSDKAATSFMDEMRTNRGNITVCREGFGYPDSCPQPSDDKSLTKCCRHYKKPLCCEPRARKVCTNKDDGNYFTSAWDIDPPPDMDAIFCPGPDQSDAFTSCGYTNKDMTCYNKNLSKALVWTSAILIFVVFPLAFGAFTIWSIRAEKLKAKAQESGQRPTQAQIEERKEEKFRAEKQLQKRVKAHAKKAAKAEKQARRKRESMQIVIEND